LQDLVLSKFSEKEWARIVAGAKCPHEYTTDRSYDDQTLYDIVAAAAKVPQTRLSSPVVREGDAAWLLSMRGVLLMDGRMYTCRSWACRPRRWWSTPGTGSWSTYATKPYAHTLDTTSGEMLDAWFGG
jgi:hypothetical protein